MRCGLVMRLHGSNHDVTHFLWVMGWGMVWVHGRTKGSVTHFLLVMGWDAETASNVTHILTVMAWSVMRLHTRKRAMSLTYWQLWHGVWWDYMAEKNNCDSLAFGHMISVMRLLGRRKGSVTYFLLSMGWDEIAYQKRGNVTHILTVMAWDVMRCDETAWKKQGQVTYYLLAMWWGVMNLYGRRKWQCGSQTVGHGIRCHETACQTKDKRAVWLTRCWLWDKMRWDYFADEKE